MSTATVYRDGKPIRTTTLTADQAANFVILANAVRDAQNVMRNKPEMDADGDALKGVTHDANVPYSESHPDDIYGVLPRLAELLGKHARAVYPHLDEAVNGEVLRNADGTPKHGLLLVHKNTPVPVPYHPAAAMASQATTLGMLPTDGLKFDYSELTDTGPAAVTESGGAKVGGFAMPVIRAHVRWRA
ncbi:MAG: hypothetical protein KKA22_12950 [Gammaproteobacteria bacterium]|nr:hypothetical protein [Gammaproteobacteria bacterium]MBU1409044.1 hypothetical protein [Gammaproteobacteria bacterium]MBU1533535.1 hypothetical protein [Gammaproteobacteria bacterium]